jgi:hypothetical protein
MEFEQLTLVSFASAAALALKQAMLRRPTDFTSVDFRLLHFSAFHLKLKVSVAHKPRSATDALFQGGRLHRRTGR